MTKSIKRRFPQICTLAAVGMMVLSAPVHARDLTIISYGGTFQDALRDVFFKPFSEKANIPVKDDAYDGGVGILRAKVQSGAVDWDIVDVEDGDLLIGCEEGLLEKLDWSKIGKKEDFLPGVVSDCGFGFVLSGHIFAYDGDKIKGDGPKSWADFFNVVKFPGKRAMRNGPAFNLEAALMADGVPPADVYKVLSTPQGVDRAFKKLETIKKNMIWWQTGAQATQLLASGEAAMTTVFNGRLHSAIKNDKRNFKIVWNGEMLSFDHWSILKGSPNQDAAYKFLSFYADPAVEKSFPERLPNGMPNKKAAELMSKDILASLPTNPEYLPQSLRFDAKYWRENTDKLTERFNKFTAQ